MEGLIKTFHIDWALLLAQIFNFAIVLFVLFRFAIKPLISLMREREEEIKKGLADANEGVALLKNASLQKVKIIKDGKIESDRISMESKKETEALRKARLAKIEEDENALRSALTVRLQMENEAKLREFEKEASKIAKDATEKILRNAMSPEVNEALVKEIIQKSTV